MARVFFNHWPFTSSALYSVVNIFGLGQWFGHSDHSSCFLYQRSEVTIQPLRICTCHCTEKTKNYRNVAWIGPNFNVSFQASFPSFHNLILLFSQFNNNLLYKLWNEHRWCARDSSPGPQDETLLGYGRLFGNGSFFQKNIVEIQTFSYSVYLHQYQWNQGSCGGLAVSSHTFYSDNQS